MFLIIFTIFLNNIFFIFGKFWTIKRVQKSKKDNSQKKDENDEENEEENDENLWLTEASKLRSFEAFVTEIEISIFGFENSTLYTT